MDNIEELWQKVLDYCRERTNDTVYDLWLREIEIGNFENGIVSLIFKTSFKKEVVVSHFGDLIEEAFKTIMGFNCLIVYYSPEDIMTDDEKYQQDLEDFKNETFTFDNFIVGPNNKFAFTAATSIAADPGGQITKGRNLSNYNPLFIYGNSGLGKTHILKAISYEIERNYPEMKIVYVTCEEFLNEFMEYLHTQRTNEFREKYRTVDVLLVDDIQFIAGKESTEEEFFHTFNALVDNGKQVVLTADRPPKEIQSLTDRLRSRFVSGLLADIQPPEYDTRCAIIKRKAQSVDLHIPDNVISYIAERIKSNIRQLEGTVKKINAMCTFSEQPVTISVAELAIKDILTDVQPLPVTIRHIVDEVSRTTGVSVDDIYSKKRTANISNARKMSAYIVREITDLSFEEIGKEFNLDHSSVMYNIRKLDEVMKTDSLLKSQVSDIINNIRDSK